MHAHGTVHIALSRWIPRAGRESILNRFAHSAGLGIVEQLEIDCFAVGMHSDPKMVPEWPEEARSGPKMAPRWPRNELHSLGRHPDSWVNISEVSCGPVNISRLDRLGCRGRLQMAARDETV